MLSSGHSGSCWRPLSYGGSSAHCAASAPWRAGAAAAIARCGDMAGRNVPTRRSESSASGRWLAGTDGRATATQRPPGALTTAVRPHRHASGRCSVDNRGLPQHQTMADRLVENRSAFRLLPSVAASDYLCRRALTLSVARLSSSSVQQSVMRMYRLTSAQKMPQGVRKTTHFSRR